MDDSVIAAMAKWPNVPDCYGWLGLDARGQWWLRDATAQQAGPFSGEGATLPSKGSRLEHEKLLAFIARNYACDEQGRWFFQNGPQRVFVELEVAPYVLRLEPDGGVMTHTGQPTVLNRVLMDELGRVFGSSALGLGVVHTQDMHRLAEQLEQERWTLETCEAATLPHVFGFVLSPLHARKGSARAGSSQA